MPEQTDELPGTGRRIGCFRCGRLLTVQEILPNPFPGPSLDRDEHQVWQYRCAMCGNIGTFQFKPFPELPQ